jgi:hypothetical protein
MFDLAILARALNHTKPNTDAAKGPDLFLQCWRLINCDDCLGSRHPCSWCAISQTCAPNAHSFPILAPIRNENICPLGWRERWEMRAKPFSCRCSTMTFISVVVGVLSTLLGVLLIWVLWKLGKWGWRKWRKRQPGWWRVDGKKWANKFMICKPRKRDPEQATATHVGRDEERRPLLV